MWPSVYVFLFADRPGECPKVELLLPENCDNNPDASCYADLDCEENEKCCMDACRYKQCTEIKGNNGAFLYIHCSKYLKTRNVTVA